MHFDLDAAQAWERLRASRWSPPGRADTGSRQKTYVAALEQSEQTFQAAAAVGTATRPMQVFYGLSQAGRAIAAAAWSLKGEDWNLTSHGIKATGFHLSFPDIQIRTDQRSTQGSFVKVSKALGSPVWEKDRCGWRTCGICCPRTSATRSPPGTGSPRCTRTRAASARTNTLS
ncbi:YaaC family protein [Streptomyces fungicidicus]|uniref:YaaC family protein n=1 Tax=Streptomyces fungicidicus TaxID=68203 RepID=UPI0036A1565C